MSVPYEAVCVIRDCTLQYQNDVQVSSFQDTIVAKRGRDAAGSEILAEV